jgi:ribosomal protein L22
MSPRKLNMIGRQIAGQPVNEAILQMQFSEKRASERIKSTLVLARNHAVDKGMDEKKLVVCEYRVFLNTIGAFWLSGADMSFLCFRQPKHG